jgi:hypothetical protein
MHLDERHANEGPCGTSSVAVEGCMPLSVGYAGLGGKRLRPIGR